MTKKKKIILICSLAVVLAAVLATVLCLLLIKPHEDSPTGNVTTISLNVNAYELVEDEVFTLSATTNSTDIVKWTSDNTAVASVSSQGRVIAKTVGEVVITASVGEVSDSCRIIVVADPNADTVMDLDKTTLRLSPASGAEQISGTVRTAEAEMSLAGAGATYTVDDPAVATVSRDGTVTPHSVGSTLVLVTASGRTKAVTVEVYTMLIGTADDWNRMLDLPGDLNARFYVTDDIDFAGKAYHTKTKNADTVLLEDSMSGSLDGGGHTIRNVTFDPSVADQSLFGTVVGFSLSHIAFENIHFTSPGAAGLAIRMVQHYDVINAAGKKMIYSPVYVTNVFGDFVYDAHGASGIARAYYGGGIENVFVRMRMSDDSPMMEAQDFAVAPASLIWYQNNYLNNVVVLAENGGVSVDWDTSSDGDGQSIDLSLLLVCHSRMEAGYYVRTMFDVNVWSVTPGALPALR